MPKQKKKVERNYDEFAKMNMKLGGFIGGKSGTGKVKARSSAQAAAAVNARWKRFRFERKKLLV